MPSIIHSGGLDTPQGLKIAGGLIYTANAANDSLSIFNQQSWAPVAVVTQGSLATPEGIAVAGGAIFVANAGSNDIATYDAKTRKPSGRITGNGLAEPLGMDQGGGVLFVVDHDTNRISRFSRLNPKSDGHARNTLARRAGRRSLLLGALVFRHAVAKEAAYCWSASSHSSLCVRRGTPAGYVPLGCAAPQSRAKTTRYSKFSHTP